MFHIITLLTLRNRNLGSLLKNTQWGNGPSNKTYEKCLRKVRI